MQKLTKTSTVNTKVHIIIASSYDSDIVKNIEQKVSVAFFRIKKESAKMFLIASKGKTNLC